MKISVITVALNEAESIKKTLDSVAIQKYDNIEHIIVDGGSSDGTFEIASDYAKAANYPVKVIRQTFSGRIYGALNEGISQATGDIIATLHANDYYPTPDELQIVADTFNSSDTSIVYGNIFYTNKKGKRAGRYSAKNFKKEALLNFFAPPHPAIFIKRKLFDQFGGYSTKYLIAGDFDLMVRFIIVHNQIFQYIDREFVAMSIGGLSTSLRHRLFTNMQEKWKVLKSHNLNCSFFSIINRYIYSIK